VRLAQGTSLAKGRRSKRNCVLSKSGHPANGRSSKGCSWNCATPTSSGITGAVSSPRKCWPTRSSCPSSGSAASGNGGLRPWAHSSAISSALPNRANWSNTRPQSGLRSQRQGQWSGGIAGHGRKDLRGLLIESAQAILRSHIRWPSGAKSCWPAKARSIWRRGAVARKLAVAIWYLLMGVGPRWKTSDERLALKVGKIITSVGPKGLQQLGKTRPTLRRETFNLLTTGRVYMLDPNKTFAPAG